MTLEFFTHKSATFSPDRVYRYRLSRTWETGLGIATWLMMNPSTADENVEDPTIRRCIEFSRVFGCVGIEIVNMFGLRSTDPSALVIHPDPVGPENDQAILQAADLAKLSLGILICAWGSLPKPSMVARARRISRLLHSAGHELHVLAVTKGRSPRHPLYLGQQCTPLPWNEWETMR